MQFLAVRNMTLLIDVRNMSVYRSDTDTDSLADKNWCETVHQKSNDFRLPLSEKIRLFERLERRGCLTCFQEQINVVVFQQRLYDLDQLDFLIGKGNILHPIQYDDTADAVLLVAQADPHAVIESERAHIVVHKGALVLCFLIQIIPVVLCIHFFFLRQAHGFFQ